MAERPLTLADLRIAAHLPDHRGILNGWWSASSGKPLFAPLQEMADDIATWFRPEQNWRLTEVATGFINLQRIEESSVAKSGPLDGSKIIIARRKEPDKFTPVFHFDADNPPITTIMRQGWFNSLKGVDLSKVFRPEFRGRIRYQLSFIGAEKGGVDVFPEKIGSIYPLEQALTDLTSPYYLVGVSVHVNQRGIRQEMRDMVGELIGKRHSQPMRSLAVSVYAQDLGDYLGLEESRIRRIRRQFKKKFPLE